MTITKPLVTGTQIQDGTITSADIDSSAMWTFNTSIKTPALINYSTGTFLFRNAADNATLGSFTNAGLWTIGDSGNPQDHAVNGSLPARKIKGDTSGTAVPAGYLGEIIGTTTVTAAGGSSKRTTNTTNLTNTPASLCAATLNKGNYLIWGMTRHTGLADGYVQAELRIGATAITSTGQNKTGVGYSGSVTVMAPVTIDTDGTVVNLYAAILGTTDGGNGVNDLFVMHL